jgi:membrane-bound serine protease (ClpP class)
MKGDKDHTALIGKVGVTDTELQPSGTVLIDNEIYDAKTDGEYVEAGRGVRVTRVRGKKIFVRRV